MQIIAYVLATLFVLLGFSAVQAQLTEIERERETLRELPQFTIVVDIQGPQLIESEREMDVRRVRRHLEERLREAELPILPTRPDGSFSDENFLYVHVNVMDRGDAIYPFAIEMSFNQPVLLRRDPSLETVARTWHQTAVGVMSGEVVVGISDAADRLLRQFISDYLGAN